MGATWYVDKGCQNLRGIKENNFDFHPMSVSEYMNESDYILFCQSWINNIAVHSWIMLKWKML